MVAGGREMRRRSKPQTPNPIARPGGGVLTKPRTKRKGRYGVNSVSVQSPARNRKSKLYAKSRRERTVDIRRTRLIRGSKEM